MSWVLNRAIIRVEIFETYRYFIIEYFLLNAIRGVILGDFSIFQYIILYK